MSERKKRSIHIGNKRPNSFSHRTGRNRLPTNNRKRQLDTVDHFHRHGRYTRIDQLDITITWYSYRVAITIASATIFGIGIGQCILKIMRWN